jgi:hypothetical protein
MTPGIKEVAGEMQIRLWERRVLGPAAGAVAAVPRNFAPTPGDTVHFSKRPSEPPAPKSRVISAEIKRIQEALSPDLLSPDWRVKNEGSGNPLVGHCYVAAEALFHRLGGREAGWQSFMLNHALWPQGCDEGETHWFLKHRSGVVADPTAGQYEGQPIAYDRGRACGFLTKEPSRRASVVLERIAAAHP